MPRSRPTASAARRYGRPARGGGRRRVGPGSARRAAAGFNTYDVDFAGVRGQDLVKRALVVAASGHTAPPVAGNPDRVHGIFTFRRVLCFHQPFDSSVDVTGESNSMTQAYVGVANRSTLRKGGMWRSARNCSASGLVTIRVPGLH